MVYVYVLQSEVRDKRYVGMTKDLDRRLAEHNAGKVKVTRAHRPWRILYEEYHMDHVSARRREKYLKSGGGRRFLKKLLSEK